MKMADNTPQAPWQPPALIVLARSRPEETVLHPCKSSITGAGIGAEQSVDKCRSTYGGGICNDNQCELFEVS